MRRKRSNHAYLTLFLERIRQIAVSIGEIGLQLDGSAIRVDCQIDESLFIVDARKVAVHNGIVGRQIQSSQIGGHRSAHTANMETENFEEINTTD